MTKLKERLAALAKRLRTQEANLAHAQKRHGQERHKVGVERLKQHTAADEADKLRRAGKIAEAELKDGETRRHKAAAYRHHLRAEHYLGAVKTAQQKIHGLEVREDVIRAELKKLDHVVISGNHATGGSDWERWRKVLLTSALNCSNHDRRNEYDEYGQGFDCQHEIAPGPKPGWRSDCSLSVTGWCWTCGFNDPNGASYSGGFTGTLVGEHGGWRKVSRAEMESAEKPAYIVYGSGNGFHTEAFLGNGITIGHGSPPVDKGVVDLFGNGDYRCYIYDPQS